MKIRFGLVIFGFSARSAATVVLNRWAILVRLSPLWTTTVCGWPGVGQLIYQAISQRDVPVTQGGVLMVSLLFVLLNLTVDVLHGVVDPRIRRAH